jgi:hypothetical protein
MRPERVRKRTPDDVKGTARTLVGDESGVAYDV